MRPAVLITLTATVVLMLVLPSLAGEPEPTPPAPAPGPTEAEAAQIEGLIRDLEAPDFMTRERASRELLKLGDKARAALQKTMAESENMEARWRAEQILRRLDREGERPMGEQPAPPPPRLEPPTSRLEEIQRRMDEIQREFDRRLEEMGLGGPDRWMPGVANDRKVIEAPGLKLEVEIFARMLVYVRLIDIETGRAWRGSDLESILARVPELAEREGVAELKTRWSEFKRSNPALFPFERPAPTFSAGFSMNGVSVTHTPDGVTVRIQEADERGNVTQKEYKGATLEEIKEKHPELADKLGPFDIDIRLGSPRIFRDRAPEPRLPVPPAPAPVPTPAAQPLPAAFGVIIVTPEPVLAVHLGLLPGHGALVTQVLPDSQAALMGVQQHDVILSVNGRPVIELEPTADALRAIGRDKAPLVLTIIRRGQRMTLER